MREFWEVRVHLVGIKKKQRTVKSHHFVLADLEQSHEVAPDLGDYVSAASETIRVEMRDTKKVILHANPYRVSVEPGFITREQRMFDPRNLRLEVTL